MKTFKQLRENFDEPYMLNLMRKAFDAKADSPEQKKLIGQLNAYRVKYGMDPVPMGEAFEPHMMYKDGKKKKAEKPEDHERLSKLGWTHEQEEAKYDYGTDASVKYIKKMTPGEKIQEVLTVAQRRARGRQMKRLAKRIAIKRKIKMRKVAGAEQLQKRANKAAKQLLRKKIAGKRGEQYKELSPQQKVMIDKMVQKRAGAIPKIARKLLPKIKKAEKERIKSLRANK